jgi:hypothetical protein
MLHTDKGKRATSNIGRRTDKVVFVTSWEGVIDYMTALPHQISQGASANRPFKRMKMNRLWEIWTTYTSMSCTTWESEGSGSVPSTLTESGNDFTSNSMSDQYMPLIP